MLLSWVTYNVGKHKCIHLIYMRKSARSAKQHSQASAYICNFTKVQMQMQIKCTKQEPNTNPETI